VEHRERYSMQIACPQCGKIGRVVWAETQTPADSGNLDQAPKMLSRQLREVARCSGGTSLSIKPARDQQTISPSESEALALSARP
jgi:hypothetical protein